MKTCPSSLVVALVLLTGCGADGGDVSSVDTEEAALTQSVSTPEGSYLGHAMVRVVNELSEAQLRAAPLKLSSPLARAIVAGRGTAGFPTLAAVDAVPGTGPVFFQKLTSFAEANGYVGKCGDGRVEPVLESCDDGNAKEGDGCSATCQVTGPVCGNGKREGAEECDSSGEACTRTCAWAVVNFYDQPGDHTRPENAIELGAQMRRGVGRLGGSIGPVGSYQPMVQYWTFTLERESKVEIDVIGDLVSAGCGSTPVYGTGEFRSADGALVKPMSANGMLPGDFVGKLPAGRYVFSVVAPYLRCWVGGSEYVGGNYGLHLTVADP